METSTKILLAVHVLGAVLWVGGGSTLHVLGLRAKKKGRAAMESFVEDASAIGPKFYAPLSVIMLIAGIFLVKKAGFEQSDVFVQIGYTGWIISFIIGVAVYPRIEKKLSAATDDAGYLAAFNTYARVNQIELLVLLLVVINMAVKPGL